MIKKRIFNLIDHFHLHSNRYYNLFKKSQWWTRERLEGYQLEQLRKLGKVWNLEIKSWEDFYSLPLTSKKDIRGFKPRKGQDYHIHRTSGSTGYPLEIYLPKDNLGLKLGMFRRHWNWAGRKNELVLRWISGEPEFAWYDYWRNVKPFNFRNITDENLDFIVERKPFLMHATVFTTREIISRLQKRKEDNILKNTILWWTGENTANHKSVAFKAFKDVYEGYGLAELTPIATECPYHRMHVTMETGIVESINGEIVVTDPFNFITPIIRYRTGDRGKIKESDCPCKRKLDILYDLEGKRVDYYDGPEVKKPIHWWVLSPISKKFLDLVEAWRAEVRPRKRKFILYIIFRDEENFERLEPYRKWVEEQTGLECEMKKRKGGFKWKRRLLVVKT